MVADVAERRRDGRERVVQGARRRRRRRHGGLGLEAHDAAQQRVALGRARGRGDVGRHAHELRVLALRQIVDPVQPVRRRRDDTSSQSLSSSSDCHSDAWDAADALAVPAVLPSSSSPSLSVGSYWGKGFARSFFFLIAAARSYVSSSSTSGSLSALFFSPGPNCRSGSGSSSMRPTPPRRFRSFRAFRSATNSARFASTSSVRASASSAASSGAAMLS